MSAAYAVIGWPLGHTLSPVMHQAALDEMGLEATYTALPTPPGSEGDRFEDVRTGKLAGLNVTIPHKLAAFRAMDRLTFAAERTGAVNTVIRDGGTSLATTPTPTDSPKPCAASATSTPTGLPSWCWAPAAPLARSYTPCSTAGPAASRWPTEPRPEATN